MTNIFLPGLGFTNAMTQQLNDVYAPSIFHPMSFDHPIMIPHGATLIAWSMGGLKAIEFCSTYNNHCKQLILCAATPFFLAKDQWPGIAAKNADLLYNLLLHSPDKFDSRFLSLVTFPRKSLSFKKVIAHYYKRPTLSDLTFLFETDHREAYSKLSIPTQVYLAGSDAILPSKAVFDALLDLNPRINVTLVHDASHAFFLERNHIQIDT